MTQTTDKKMDFTKKVMLARETYTFTVNPDDKHQLWNNQLNRLAKAMALAQKELSYILNAEYELYPEISPKGRIHFHGYINIIDNVDFLLYDVRRLEKWSKYEIDTLTDPQVWQCYIQKDKETMKRYCNQKTINYKLTNKLKALQATSPIVEALNITMDPIDDI